GIFFFDTDAPQTHDNTLTDLGFGLVQQGTFTTVIDHADNTYNNDAVNLGFYPEVTGTPGFTVSGTSGRDDLEGNAGVDHLNGLGGNDLLVGFGGDDVLDGGAGNDSIDGGPGPGTANRHDARLRPAHQAGHSGA